MKKFLGALALALASVTSAHAASYSFDLVWDGATLTPVSGMAGTVLNNGDDFTLTVRADGNGFWTGTGSNGSLPINPRLGATSGGTTGNTTTTGFLGAAQAFQFSDPNSTRCCAELGIDNWTIGAGVIFDKVVLNYTLVSSDNGMVDLAGGLWRDPFIGASFTAVPVNPVPLPAAAFGYLTILGAGGVVAARKRRRAA